MARNAQNQLRCELCDVSCTGADAYAAHIRGAKHQKVNMGVIVLFVALYMSAKNDLNVSIICCRKTLTSILYSYLTFLLQVVKLHTKLGKPIPSTEPSMVTQTSSSTTSAPSKTTTATLSSSSTTSSLCVTASSSSSSATSSSPPYLKPVNIVSSSVAGAKNPLASNLSSANSVSAGKKVSTPKINFVGG